MDQEFQDIVDEYIELCDEWLDSGKLVIASAGILTLLDDDGVYRDYTVKRVHFQWDSDCTVDLSQLWNEDYDFGVQEQKQYQVVAYNQNESSISNIPKPNHSFPLSQLKALSKKGKMAVPWREDWATNLEALGLNDPKRFNNVVQDLQETDFIGPSKKCHLYEHPADIYITDHWLHRSSIKRNKLLKKLNRNKELYLKFCIGDINLNTLEVEDFVIALSVHPNFYVFKKDKLVPHHAKR